MKPWFLALTSTISSYLVVFLTPYLCYRNENGRSHCERRTDSQVLYPGQGAHPLLSLPSVSDAPTLIRRTTIARTRRENRSLSWKSLPANLLDMWVLYCLRYFLVELQLLLFVVYDIYVYLSMSLKLYIFSYIASTLIWCQRWKSMNISPTFVERVSALPIKWTPFTNIAILFKLLISIVLIYNLTVVLLQLFYSESVEASLKFSVLLNQ